MTGGFVSRDHVVASPLVAGNVDVEFAVLALHGFVEDRFPVRAVHVVADVITFGIPPPPPFQGIYFNFYFPVGYRFPVGCKYGTCDGDWFPGSVPVVVGDGKFYADIFFIR